MLLDAYVNLGMTIYIISLIITFVQFIAVIALIIQIFTNTKNITRLFERCNQLEAKINKLDPNYVPEKTTSKSSKTNSRSSLNDAYKSKNDFHWED